MRSPVKLLPQDSRIELPSAVVTRTWRPPGFALARHTHEHTNIALCVSGSYEESLDDTWLRVTAATLICRPGGVPHANNYVRGPSRAVIFELPTPTLNVISRFSRVLDEPLHLDSAEVAGFARRADAQLSLADNVSPLVLDALMYELIAVAARRGRPERALSVWLRRVKDFIDSEFRRTVTIDELACVAGVHPSHLARSFRARFGRSVGTYVRERRIAEGARLLRESALSIVEVSGAVGFYDQSHFTRAFSRQMSISPARYRRGLRP